MANSIFSVRDSFGVGSSVAERAIATRSDVGLHASRGGPSIVGEGRSRIEEPT
jgi:hypothetical protein